jgi:hypothetical protein
MTALPTFAFLLLESQKHQKPLPALAHWFVNKICDGDTTEFSISRIHEKATGYKPALSLEEELKTKLFEKLSPVEAEKFWQMHLAISASRVHAAQCLLPSNSSTDDNTMVNKRVIEAAAGDAQHNSNKKHKRDTNKNQENAVYFRARDFRDEFGKAQEKSKKVQVYIDAVAEVQAQIRDGKELIDPLKSWSYRAGRVALCVAECFENEIDDFLLAHLGGLSKFKCPKGCKHEPTFDRSKL